jgi:hypothetical protein
MKRINGIIGASLAGFAVLTMAAITSTTTEAIAFKAPATHVGVTAPTHMKSVSQLQRFPLNRISVVQNRLTTGSVPTPTQQRSQPTFHVHQSSVATVFVPTKHKTPAQNVGSCRTYGEPASDADFSFAEMPNEKWNTLKDVFAGRMVEELLTPLPEGVDPSKLDTGPTEGRPSSGNWDDYINWIRQNDASNRNPYTQLGNRGRYTHIRLTENDSTKLLNWDGYGRQYETVDYDFSVEANYLKSGNGSKDGSSGTSAGTKPQNDLGGEKPKDRETQESEVKKEQDNSNGGEGDDGNDPDEMRNGITGMEGVAAMGGDSGSNRDGAPGNTPQRADGHGWERHRQSIGGNGAADPDEIIGPAETGNPAGSIAAAFNHMTGQANSPTVDDQHSGNGPSGPIGPRATQTQAGTFSVEMSNQLTAAMSDPMGSPTVDDRESGNGPGGPIGPVADHIR